jgi:TetR/AcrR family transcriptional repressor of nem operon
MARRPDPSIRTRILEQAEHLMHLRGFNNTSLEDIASACSMTKANLFHHFKSKEELGLAVLDFKMEAYRCDCMGPLSCCEDPIGAVKKLFTDAACFYKGNGCKAGCFVGNIALEMSDLNERFRAKAEAFFEEWAGGLETALKRARANGLFSSAMRPRATAEAILALYEGAIMLARTRRDPAVFDRISREAVRLLESQLSVTRTKEVSRNGS